MRVGFPEAVFPSIASRLDAVVIRFTVILWHFNVARRNLVSIAVDLSPTSPGMAGRSSEKSLEFFGGSADYADFTGRNREDLPDGTTDVASACTKPK
jgi:hypothetical protein